MEELSTVFDQAAKLLERDGWCQGQFTRHSDFRREPRRCLLGALRAVIIGEEGFTLGGRGCDVTPNMQRQMSASSEQLFVTAQRHGIVDAASAWKPAIWNDEPGRTVEDVISLLRKASEDCQP